MVLPEAEAIDDSIMMDTFKLAANLGMIIGPCAGYMVQIRKMYNEKICEGFSTYVSFILILSNLIRIYWW